MRIPRGVYVSKYWTCLLDFSEMSMSTLSWKKKVLVITIHFCYSCTVCLVTGCNSCHLVRIYLQLKLQDHLAETVKILCRSQWECLHFHPIFSKKYHVTLSKLNHLYSAYRPGCTKSPLFTSFAVSTRFTLYPTHLYDNLEKMLCCQTPELLCGTTCFRKKKRQSFVVTFL